MNLKNIPAELKSLPQWVAWRTETRNGKPTKVPVDPRTGRLASSTDAKTWGTFDEANELANSRVDGDEAGGVGFVFAEGGGYVGIDLDDCIDPDSGAIDPDAFETISRFGSYHEKSPSGTGVHIIVRGQLPPGGRKRGDRECYDRGRFFTMTGDCFGSPLPVADGGAELDRWHAETFPTPAELEANWASKPPVFDATENEIIAKIEASKQNPKFQQLMGGKNYGYASGSEADLALCGLLAFWCQCDPQKVDGIFRKSQLMRGKWDAKRGETTYGARTVSRACSNSESYNPEYKKKSPPATFEPTSNTTAPTATTTQETGPARHFKWASELTAPAKADDWVWDGYLPRGGITMLSALWKVGKTTLLSHLLRACGEGGQFLGRPLQPAKVLYVSEEGERHWVRRRDALELKDNTGFYLQPFPTKPLQLGWQAFVKQLASDVETHGFDLVVFDTLAKLWPVREENDSGAVDEALMPLWTVASAGKGAAILLIHHMRKSGGEEYTGSRGSGALSAFPDIIVEMKRFDAADKSCRKRKLEAKGRYEETPDELVIELVDGAYRALSTDEVTAIRQEATHKEGDNEEARVVAYLAGTPEPWSTSEEIRVGLRGDETGGMRNKDIVAHLTSLYQRGLVQITGKMRSPTNPRRFALSTRSTCSTPKSQVGNEKLSGGELVVPTTRSPLDTKGRNESGTSECEESLEF